MEDVELDPRVEDLFGLIAFWQLVWKKKTPRRGTNVAPWRTTWLGFWSRLEVSPPKTGSWWQRNGYRQLFSLFRL